MGLWLPSQKQREAKAKFWSRMDNNPLVSPESLTNLKIAHHAGYAQCAEWLQDALFRDWFFNKESTKQMIQAAAEVAVARLWALLEQPVSREVKASDHISAANTLLKYGGFEPAKSSTVTYKDKTVGEMSEADLKKFVARERKQLKPVQ